MAGIDDAEVVSSWGSCPFF